MRSFEFDSALEGYPALVRELLDHGDQITSRVGDVLEIEDVCIEFDQPQLSVPPRRRGFSPLLGLMEGAQLVGSHARPTLMDALWPSMKDYTDHWGDYGDRAGWYSQLEKCFENLRKYPDTRRAIVSLWDPTRDADGGHMDHPCTLSIGFRIRDDALNMSVTMRSNDIMLGASSDFIQFALLQITFAKALGVSVGTYTHYVHSLHLYTKNIGMAAEFLEENQAFVEANGMPNDYGYVLGPLSEEGWSYDQIAEEAETALRSTGECATLMGRHIKRNVLERHRKLDSK